MARGPNTRRSGPSGAAVGVSDLAAATKANYICNELGLDTISAGATIACAMELVEKGVLTEQEVGGPLRFGDGEALVRTMKQIGYREGFGDVLAEGGARVAVKYGRPELFMGVKKQEFPAYDPRGILGMGLQYATSNRGACHVRGYMISAEILGVPVKMDPHTTAGKAAMNIAFQDLTAALDSSGICLFVTFSIGAPELVAMLKTATGFDYDVARAAARRRADLEPREAIQSASGVQSEGRHSAAAAAPRADARRSRRRKDGSAGGDARRILPPARLG